MVARKASTHVAEAAAPFVLPQSVRAVGYMDRSGKVDVDRMMEGFGMSRVQLAETAGLSRDTFQKAARRDAPKTRARLLEILEIIGRVHDWAGGQAQAMAWYRSQPIPELGGRTAEAMVKSGEASLVRDYLDHFALGGFA
jgi:hypothetical protein